MFYTLPLEKKEQILCMWFIIYFYACMAQSDRLINMQHESQMHKPLLFSSHKYISPLGLLFTVPKQNFVFHLKMQIFYT